LGLGELLVALLDRGGFFWDEALKEGEEFGRLEAFKEVVGLWTLVGSRGADDNDGEFGVELFELGDEVAAGHVADASVEDDAVEAREGLEGIDSLERTVGGDDIELRGLDDEFAG
jgi:hypothetical protein